MISMCQVQTAGGEREWNSIFCSYVTNVRPDPLPRAVSKGDLTVLLKFLH